MRLVALTEKQKRFCDEYLIDLNATQAAIRAGYSEKTARQTATENLSKPYIREYIDKRLAEKDAELIADQDEVLKYLTSVMRREKNEHIVVTTSEEKRPMFRTKQESTKTDGKKRSSTDCRNTGEAV